MQDESETATHSWVKPMTAMCATFSDAVLTVLSSEYGGLRHKAKVLASHAKTSHRTAEKWLARQAVPSGENLMNLLVECDALLIEINRIAEERRAANSKN